jgi:hypothetical protein
VVQLASPSGAGKSLPARIRAAMSVDSSR